jgi:hypothetical protein
LSRKPMYILSKFCSDMPSSGERTIRRARLK